MRCTLKDGLDKHFDKLGQSVQAVKGGDSGVQEDLFLKVRSAMLSLTLATFAGDGIVDNNNIGNYVDMVNQGRVLITDPRFNEQATAQVRGFLRTCFEREPQLYSAIPAPLKREYVSFL